MLPMLAMPPVFIESASVLVPKLVSAILAIVAFLPLALQTWVPQASDSCMCQFCIAVLEDKFGPHEQDEDDASVL